MPLNNSTGPLSTRRNLRQRIGYSPQSQPGPYGSRERARRSVGYGGSNREGGVGTYVNERVPVESFSQQRPERGPEVEPPEVGLRWGRPASLSFQLSNYAGETQDDSPPSSGVVEQNDEAEVVTGFGVRQAVDHNGFVVAEGPGPTIRFDGTFLWEQFTVFQGTTLTEEDEERETAPTGVVFITPITRIIRRYIVWDFIEEMQHDVYSKVLNWDGPIDPPPVSRRMLPTEISVTWTEPRPRKYLGQSNGGSKRFEYHMTGALR